MLQCDSLTLELSVLLTVLQCDSVTLELSVLLTVLQCDSSVLLTQSVLSSVLLTVVPKIYLLAAHFTKSINVVPHLNNTTILIFIQKDVLYIYALED